MKAYITCPVSHTQERLELLPKIQSVVEANGIDAFVFGIDGTPEEIFKEDFAQIKSSDLIIAEVSETSHGVGAEIGMSYCLNLKRILLLEKGKYVSKLLEGMPNTIIIEYADPEDMQIRLASALSLKQ